MIQYPEVKTIAPSAISKQGAGKGTYVKLMSKMLGPKTLQKHKHLQEMFGETLMD